MNSLLRLAIVITILVLMLPNTPSWGEPVCAAPGCNATVTDANGNTAGGTDALKNVFFGHNNTAFGWFALKSDTSGVNNTAIGVGALNSNTTGENNTASGYQALGDNTTGGGNTANGCQALANNTIGLFNTATGDGALGNNTTGTGNTATGSGALNSNTTGNDNSASGVGALGSNTTGNNNSASGIGALGSNTTGNNNTASGTSALESNTTGNENTATGFHALFANTEGDRNTAVGRSALLHSTGTKNIGIGYQAGATLTTGNNNIYIGNQGNGDEFQTIRLGTVQTRTFIAGIATTPIVENSATVEIDTATGQLGVAGGSSARFKRDIEAMGSRSEKVLELRPVTFAYKDDTHGVTHYGLVAEEVEKVYPELVTHAATGEVQTVKYQELIPMLLNELQRQRQELAELRALVGQGRGAEAAIPSATGAVSGTDASPR